jgi:hypothetical protein
MSVSISEFSPKSGFEIRIRIPDSESGEWRILIEGEGGQTDISRRTIEQKLPIPVDCGAQGDI